MPGSATLSRGDRVLFSILAAASAAIGLVSLLSAIGRARLYLLAAADGGTPLSLSTVAPLSEIPGSGSPRIEFGVFPTADLVAHGLTDGTRALLSIGEGLGMLLTIVVGVAVAAFFLSLARGRPFARPLFRLALVAGGTLALGSLVAQLTSGFGEMNAALELNPIADDVFIVGFDVDPAPLVLGFAIMALAAVFRAGSRLERDTEGLV
jgi:hypothetical protein